jgi:hypothetical protein
MNILQQNVNSLLTNLKYCKEKLEMEQAQLQPSVIIKVAIVKVVLNSSNNVGFYQGKERVSSFKSFIHKKFAGGDHWTESLLWLRKDLFTPE